MRPPRRRTIASVKANPLASAEDLAWLRWKEPLAALAHPNCPPEIWWELASDRPLEAIQSPAGSLFLLEDPARWAEIEIAAVVVWINQYCDKLSEADKYRFGADCAERVLPIFEAEYPDDPRPRLAIKRARDYVNGHLTKEQLTSHLHEAIEAYQDARKAPFAGVIGIDKAAVDAAYAAFKAIDGGPWAVARHARIAVREKGGNVEAEEVWQWRRLLRYLLGESPR